MLKHEKSSVNLLYKLRKKCYNYNNSIRKEERAMTKVIRYTSDYAYIKIATQLFIQIM